MKAPNLAGHQRRIERRMTASVELVVRGPAVWDEETESVVVDWLVAWSGPAIVRPTSRVGQTVVQADDSIDIRSYDVLLPATATVPGDARVKVIKSVGDPRLVGVSLTILEHLFDDWQTCTRLVCQWSA